MKTLRDEIKQIIGFGIPDELAELKTDQVIKWMTRLDSLNELKELTPEAITQQTDFYLQGFKSGLGYNASEEDWREAEKHNCTSGNCIEADYDCKNCKIKK